MAKFSREKFFSSPGIFVIYIIASCIAIMGFRLVYPGERAPLACFNLPWRFLRGCLDYLNLFPALSLSALIIPFGWKSWPSEKFGAFSPAFLQSLKSSIFTAIAAAAICALLALLVFPLARDYEASLRSRGELFNQAKEEARAYAALGEWENAARFVGICERIWPGSPETAALKIESSIRLETTAAGSPAQSPDPGSLPGLPSQTPVNAADALRMAETALNEERYYDAHWLATLGGRLARQGSAETEAAARLSSQAWNAVNSLEPNSRETEAYRIYRLKRDGYEALVSGEWIRAYYIFRELTELSPEDPDAARYLELSEQGTGRVAFFVDEMEMDLGEVITGALFSLPLGMNRVVMRLASLALLSDSAYGLDMEILAFDRDGRPAWSMEAPYVKFIPFSLDSGPRVTVLARALGRNDSTNRWEPLVQNLGETAPAEGRVSLSMRWEDFLLLARVRRGHENLSAENLLAASRVMGNYGYLPQVFEAELIDRFAGPVLFLPLAILVIVIGWGFRAKIRSRYMCVPMLGILPLVLHGFILFFRSCLNEIGIVTVITLGFPTAAMVFGAAAFALFMLSLIILAAQHG
jgi:hypothetical protein